MAVKKGYRSGNQGPQPGAGPGICSRHPVNILALDTSTPGGTVALVADGHLVAEITARTRARHGETLLSYVDRVLELGGLGLADLDAIGVGLGPGSFTGLRVGLSTAKGLVASCALPLVGVVSLRVLARAAGEGTIVSAVDAHRGEIYAAAYDVGPDGARERVAPFHATPTDAGAELAARLGSSRLAVCGDAARGALTDALGRDRCVELPPLYDTPRAAVLALEAEVFYRRGEISDAASLEPLYVRPSDAKLPR